MSVGVIIPVIDIDLHFLPGALEAIDAMEPPPDVVTVIHDGSDAILAYVDVCKCNSFHNKDKRGTGAAINQGIRETYTDWIICQGADDRLKPWFVDEIQRADQSCDILATGYEVVGNGDPLVLPPPSITPTNRGIPFISPFRRSLYTDKGLRWDENPLNYRNDGQWWSDCIDAGAKVGYIQRACSEFMVRPDSLCERLKKGVSDGERRA